MIAHRRLTNPPIKEALIDLRVALGNEVGVEKLGEIHEQIRREFPIRKYIHHGFLSVQFDAETEQPPKATSDHSVLGFRYESEDGARIVQFRLNGFTYSRVGAYTTWEDMRDEARQLWPIFLDAISPETVTRIATRFINVLPVPLPLDEFEEYVTAPPRIPSNLPQAMSQFLTRVVVPHPDMDATAVITQALESTEPDKVPIVLDIDVFVKGNFGVDDITYWERLEQLRDFKNKIFFASITEKTAELCQ